MELFGYVYFCAQKSRIKAGNNESKKYAKFQELINAPRTFGIYTVFQFIKNKHDIIENV